MTEALKKVAPIIILFTLFRLDAWAQIVPPGGNPNEAAPLDGVTTLMLAAGIGYGIARILKKQKT